MTRETSEQRDPNRPFETENDAPVREDGGLTGAGYQEALEQPDRPRRDAEPEGAGYQEKMVNPDQPRRTGGEEKGAGYQEVLEQSDRPDQAEP